MITGGGEGKMERAPGREKPYIQAKRMMQLIKYGEGDKKMQGKSGGGALRRRKL